MIGRFFYRIHLLVFVGFCTEFYTYALWKAAKHSPLASFGHVCMCWTRDFTTCHHTRESWAQIQVAFFGGVHILNQLYKEMSVDVSLDWQLGHWGFQQSSFDPVQALGLRIAISSAITCCEKDQQWQHGVSLLFNMASNRNAPNVVSCSEIYFRLLWSRLHSKSLIVAFVFMMSWLLDRKLTVWATSAMFQQAYFLKSSKLVIVDFAIHKT